MAAKSRTKGAGFEREVAKLFGAALGREFSRNLSQPRDGGTDLFIGPLVVEAKRRARLVTLGKWMQQARTAAVARVEADPEAVAFACVVMREDHGEPMILLALDDFLTLAHDELLWRMREK